MRLAQGLTPDILLLDLPMPRLPELEALGRLGDGNSGVRTLLLVNAIDQPQVIKALEWGARGIVLKESPTELLFKGIRSVMAGQHWVGRDTVSALVETLVETIARQQKGAQAPQTWSLHVTRNWRLTFRVDAAENEILDVNYEDYH